MYTLVAIADTLIIYVCLKKSYPARVSEQAPFQFALKTKTTKKKLKSSFGNEKDKSPTISVEMVRGDLRFVGE